MKEKVGLGDIVESTIKTIAPGLARRYKNCSSCKKKKLLLNRYKFRNNKNANFS